MSPSLEQIKSTLSELPPSEKAELAYFLLDSLEPADEGVAEAWRVELRRRAAEIRSGKVIGKPVEEVLARLRGSVL
jgi:putative addiction module component (TIGR02574 family)